VCWDSSSTGVDGGVDMDIAMMCFWRGGSFLFYLRRRRQAAGSRFYPLATLAIALLPFLFDVDLEIQYISHHDRIFMQHAALYL